MNCKKVSICIKYNGEKMKKITKKHILAGLLMAALVGPTRTECFNLTPATQSLLGNILGFITTSVSVGSFFALVDRLVNHKRTAECSIKKHPVTSACERFPSATITVTAETFWLQVFRNNLLGRKIEDHAYALHTHCLVSCDKKCPLKDKQNCPFLKELKTVWDDPTKE